MNSATSSAPCKGSNIQFGGGPQHEDWYGTLDAVCDGRLDPHGPPRIVVHPNG